MIIPVWLTIAIWIVWGGWTLIEIKGPFELYRHNSNRFLVMTQGKAFYSSRAKMVTYAYLIITSFWISWNIWG
jgi:hypothetical protein